MSNIVYMYCFRIKSAILGVHKNSLIIFAISDMTTSILARIYLSSTFYRTHPRQFQLQLSATEIPLYFAAYQATVFIFYTVIDF